MLVQSGNAAEVDPGSALRFLVLGQSWSSFSVSAGRSQLRGYALARLVGFLAQSECYAQ